ncbi:Uncharacterised protein [Burkholderia oklahomensis]|uniref:hypothetical protein n=1 Tax=Burkholderia oklahomensis TaxID=342113 RepID=UPI00016A33C3|nr:transposase domain protein [Burkholderia oklahomensis C6786]AOI41743.1 hypothetical protein WG70_18910 [Burkholderia oklahomensis EO147]MBI0358599.1 hypothetical protein [Burkholderia oklahomensis]AOI45331.1 hypothetical protein WI23_05665 [Burkholderia oklahomensis C6786]KUY59634.1 hypothetical protein WI23_16450 [Burkholderia oklahomensis C6786]
MAEIRRRLTVLAAHDLPPRLIARLDRLQAHSKYLNEQAGEVERELMRQSDSASLISSGVPSHFRFCDASETREDINGSTAGQTT